MLPIKTLTITAVTLVALNACNTTSSRNLDDAQYWQRSAASQSTYMRGKKAQQMLNRDIANCVVEMKELEILGQYKDTIRMNENGGFADPEYMDLKDWDLPERDRDLFIEHKNYQDFYGCMLAKGWERIEFSPYTVNKDAKDIYVENHVRLREHKRTPPQRYERHDDD